MPEAVSAAPAATPGVPGQNATQSAPPPNAPNNTSQAVADSKAQPPPPEYFEVTINGQPRKYTREQAIAKIALGEGANEKFESAAQQRKQIEQIQKHFDADPFEATILYYESKGIGKAEATTMARHKFEQAYKQRFIEPEMMTPEQKEAHKWKQERDKLLAEKEERDNQTKQETEGKQRQEAVNNVQQEIITALEKSDLPKTRFYAHRIAFFKQQNLKKGYDAPDEVIIQQVKQEGEGIIGGLVQTASVEQLLKVAPDLVKKIRAYDMEQLKKKYEPTQAPPTQSTAGTTDRKKGGKSMRDVDNYFNELRRTKK